MHSEIHKFKSQEYSSPNNVFFFFFFFMKPGLGFLENTYKVLSLNLSQILS